MASKNGSSPGRNQPTQAKGAYSRGRQAGVKERKDMPTGKIRILEAARRHFEGRSYAETRVEDICREAGISKGAFYLYFSTKEEMMEELFVQFFLEIQAQTREFLVRRAPSSLAVLELFRTSLEMTAHQLHMTRVLFEALGAQIASRDEGLNGFAGKVFDNMATDVQKWLKLPASRKIKIRALISCMDGMVLHWAFFHTSEAQRKRQIDAFLEMVDHSTSGVLPDPDEGQARSRSRIRNR